MTKRKHGRPVGRGYMPKGGVKAAQAHNAEWKQLQDEAAATVARESVPASDSPSHREGATGGRASGLPGSHSTAAAFGGVGRSLGPLYPASIGFAVGGALNALAALMWGG